MSISPTSAASTRAGSAPVVTALYHPTLAVHDLEAAREWFTRVFAQPDFRWEDTLDPDLLEPDYPRNYSFFYFIKDMHFVVLCPQLHARGALEGQTRYRDVPEGMIGVGWYTNGAAEFFDRLADHGFSGHDQRGQSILAGTPPLSPMARDIYVGFTDPGPAGYRHEFVELGDRHVEYYSRRADPRLRPGWTRPAVDPTDPLGIVRTSHHTFVTGDLDRATRLYVTAAGGSIVRRGRNSALQGDSMFVALGDTVVEFTVPDAGSPVADRVVSGLDHYLGITLQVEDVEAARAHLREVGVQTGHDSTAALTIEPEHAFGMQWRFVTALPY